MKSILKAGLTTLLLSSSSVYALDPVQGIYAGIFLGGSKARAVNITAAIPNLIINGASLAGTGRLDFGAFGDIGGQVGYRMDQFRVEGELSYNNSPYNSLTINGTKFTKKGNSKHNTNATNPTFKGQTGIAALMLNGYYDNYSMFDQSCFVPYIGIGLGYANIQNRVDFYRGNVAIPNSSFSIRHNAFAGQAIIGTSYFMDDFTAFALDFRYFSTGAVPAHYGTFASTNSVRFQYLALNLSFNGSFDAG